METVIDAPHQQQNFTYAGFWIRLAAYFIDNCIVGAVSAALIVPLSLSMASDVAAGASTLGIIGLAGIIALAAILYYPLMESSERQATLGKLAVGIRVGDSTGAKISFANALGRFFSKIISGMILYIGYIMIAWDDKKQGLHDKIASTYVFYK